MDPDATYREMVATAANLRELLDGIESADEMTEAQRYELTVEAERIAELVDALDGWLAQGGFPPSVLASRTGPSPTPAQGLAFARFMRDQKPRAVHVQFAPFDLPDGYLRVSLNSPKGGIVEGGIAPDGTVST